MMNNFKLGDLLKIKHGYAFKSENYVNKSDVVLVTLANISEHNEFQINIKKSTFYGSSYPKDFNLKEGDLIMPLTEQVVGLLGNSAFVPHIEGYQLVLNQRVGKVVPDTKKVDPVFLHFLLGSDYVKKQLEARANGTKQRNISPDDVYEVSVQIPDLITQKKIGEVLYNYEQLIIDNENIMASIRRIIDLIYKSWFFDFEFPDNNGKPYKSSGGKMKFCDAFQCDIPADWDVRPLSHNALVSILDPGISRFMGNKQYLATADVKENEIGFGSEITYENRESRANMQPILNSVWFAKMKNTIKHLVVTENDNWICDKFIFSTGFCGLKVRENALCYINSFINSDFFENNKDRLAHGATQEAVNDGDLNLIKLLIPSEDVLIKFETICLPLLIKENACRHEKQELARMRDYFMPTMINGQSKL